MSVNGDDFTQLIRVISLAQAKIFTKQLDMHLVTDLEDVKLGDVLSQRLVLVNLSADNARLLIKLHHDEKIDELVSMRVARHAKSPTMEAKIEYVKEMANLICSHLAAVLERSGVFLSMSLPLATRGYYEIYSQYEQSSDPSIKFSDLFAIKNDKHLFYFTVQVELSEHKLLSETGLGDSDPEPESKIEFL